MYKAVIFDLDGVLIETEGIHARAMAKTFLSKGYQLSDADIKSLIGRAPVEYVPDLTKKNGWDIGELSVFLDLFRGNFHPVWDKEVKLKSGVKELFELLKQKNIQISLATNSSLKTVEKFVSKFTLENVFTNITTGDEVSKRKPDPEIYKIAKSKTHLPDSEILVVEDSEVGWQAAKEAGLSTVVVPNKYTKDQNFSKANYIFKAILEVASLF
jgi:HAD superfamily hydrolase (TIGR01509 family)